MNRKRIKAAVVLVLFLVAGVLYSTDRNQDFFVMGTTESQEQLASGDEAESGKASVQKNSSSEEDDSGNGESQSDESESAFMSETTDEGALRIHVCGAVKKAGVYRLPEHSIVADALAAADGVCSGGAEDCLNLATELSDGDKIYVPYVKELEALAGDTAGGTTVIGMNGSTLLQDGQNGSGSGTAGGKDSGGANSSLVNINTADEALLTTLNGIGAARAQAIISWRNEHGAFSKIEDIMQVSGIKEGAYAKIKDQICVSG